MNTRVLAHPFSRSLLIHLVLLALAFWFAFLAPPIPLHLGKEEISFEVIEPHKITDLDSKSKSKTIVKPSEGEEAKQAKQDSFLSDKTRTVTDERSAKVPGENVYTSPAVSKPQSIAAPTKPVATKVIKLSDLGLKLDPIKENAAFEKQRNWAESQTGETIRGGEYIHGMKEGEVSALNTKEYVFYSYYERVRRQLDQSWQPLLRGQIEKIYKHGRHLASNSDYVTKTLVTLNERGEVARVQLLEESGTTDLDQAAIDALNKAGPYPNPPRGLMDSSGQVQIRWDFILKT